MKQSSKVRTIIPYGVLIVFLLIGLLLARPLHSFIQDRLLAFQASLIAMVEKSSGLKLRYERLNPSILLQAEISGFRLLRSDGSDFFSAEKVRISYNIFQFLSAVPLDAVHNIELEGSVLSWDENRDAMFRPRQQLENGSGAIKPGIVWLRSALDDLSGFLPKGLQVSFIETKVDLKAKTWQAGFLVSRAKLSSTPESLDFALDVNIAVQNLSVLKSLGAISGQAHAEGTFFRINRQIQAQVSTSRFQTALGVLSSQKFAAVLGNDALLFRKVEDNQAFDLQLAWNFDTDNVNIDLTTDHWRPVRAFEPDPSMNVALRSVLDASFNSQISASLALKTGEFNYEFKIDGEGQDSKDGMVILSAQGQGNRKRLDGAHLHVEIPGLLATFDGSLDFASTSTRGMLNIEVFAPLLSVPLVLQTSVSGLPHTNGPAFNLDDLILHTGDTVLQLGSVPVSYSAGRIAFSVNGSVIQDELPKGTLNLAGSIGVLPNIPFLILGGTVHGLPVLSSNGLIRTIVAAAGAELAENTLKGLPSDLSADGNFDLLLDHVLTLNVKDIVLAQPTKAPLYTGIIRFINETLISENSRLDLGFSSWDVDAQLHFLKKGPLTLDLDLDRGKPKAIHINGKLQTDNTFELQGPFGFFMDGNFADGGIKAFARIEDAPMEGFGPSSRLAATARFAIDDNSNWELTIRDADINNISWNPVFPGRVGRLLLRDGQFFPNSAHFAELRYQDVSSALSGTVDLQYDIGTLPDLIAHVNLEGRSSLAQPLAQLEPERIGLDLQISKGLVHSTLAVSNSTLQRFNDAGFKGSFNLKAVLDASLAHWTETATVSGAVKIPQGFWFKDPLSAGVNFSMEQGKISLDEGIIDFPGKRILVDSMMVDSSSGSLNVQAHYEQPQETSFNPVAIMGAFNWNPHPAIGVSGFFNDFRGKLSARDVRGVDGVTRNYEAQFAGVNNVLEFSESINNAFRGRIQQDGGFLVQLQQALPITATISGFVHNDKIEANIFNINFDLATLSSFLDISLFHMLGGNLTGSLRVVGDIFDPDFYGSLRVNAMKARFSMSPEDISVPLGYLVFEEKKMRLLPVQAAAGAATVRMDADFTLSRLSVTDFVLNFETVGPKGLHIVSNFSNIATDGYGKGRFVVAYSPAYIDLRGQLTVEDTKLQISAQPVVEKTKRSPYEPESIPINVKLDLRSGKSVEFYWPSISLPLLRTTLDINQSASFSFNELSKAWSLVGNLATRGGEIMYLKRNFFLRQASISFNENQNKDFDPIINARADTKIIVDNKQAKVALVFKDCFLSNLQPRIESDLVMSNDQLNAVISGDFVKVNGSNADTMDAIVTNSLGYATVALIPNFESRIRDFLGLDLFSLRSNLLPNLAKSALSNYGNPLDTQTTSLGKYFDNTTVQFGKFLGTDLYIELMAQARSVSTFGPQANPLGLTADLELSMEWETPFFNLQWNLAPKNLQQPELRDFIRNNSFQFSWQIR